MRFVVASVQQGIVVIVARSCQRYVKYSSEPEASCFVTSCIPWRCVFLYDMILNKSCIFITMYIYIYTTFWLKIRKTLMKNSYLRLLLRISVNIRLYFDCCTFLLLYSNTIRGIAFLQVTYNEIIYFGLNVVKL